MSSGDDSSQASYSDNETRQHSRPSSRRQSHTPGTPRKRRRIESVEPSRVRKYNLEGKYNDAYRVLFNEEVNRAAARLNPSEYVQHYSTQYGASTWSGGEQAFLFAALERLGKDDVPGIAQAVGTKTVTETRELLLLLDDAAVKQGDAGVTMRDVPAAIEIGQECNKELDVMAEALAWYQEQFEVVQEQERYGDYWLITPEIAEHVEDALNGSSRVASTRPTTPADPGTPRVGPGIAGSCERCKHHKIRCDRKIPCTNCARMKKKVTCQYKPSKHGSQSVDLTPHTPNLEEPDQPLARPAVSAQPQIIQAIPEASLLHAENMLLLSKNLFMNRSSDIPSPWPHWSTYASEQVPEPSILRTAFNDFHTLAVSVTQRLMQTAVMQATSRLRSQRRRTKKGVRPFVKTRDVLSAIDVLGLKRNGRSRWKGVARRCNVQVFDEHRTTRFKSKQREISWDQAEQILSLYDAVAAPPAGEARGPGSSDDGETFEKRAARSGTPLPMDHLTLSTSGSDEEVDGEEAGYDSAFSLKSEDDFALHGQQRDRDLAGRFTSLAPGQVRTREVQSLDMFDEEASRQEAEALSSRLGFSVSTKENPSVGSVPDGNESADSEHLATSCDSWRNWTEYRATWDEFQSSIPSAKFVANQNSRKTSSAVQPRRLHNVSDESSDGSDASSASPRMSPKLRRRLPGMVELRAHNPRVYAAMQNTAFNIDNASGPSPSSSGSDLGADVPAQSVENTDAAHYDHPQGAMEWER